jgi:hypothetical protein
LFFNWWLIVFQLVVDCFSIGVGDLIIDLIGETTGEIIETTGETIGVGDLIGDVACSFTS